MLRKENNGSIYVEELRVPLRYMSEGLSNYLPTKQTMLELNIPIVIKKEIYDSWVTLRYSSTGKLKNVNGVIEGYRSNERYKKTEVKDGYEVYRQKKPWVSFSYIVPELGRDESIHFRCELNCTASTVTNGVIVSYHFPAKNLGQYSAVYYYMQDVIGGMTSS